MDFAHGFHLWRALGMTGDGDMITQDALVAIHWTHRTFAIVVVAYLVWFALKLRRFESLRRPANGVLLVVADPVHHRAVEHRSAMAVAHCGRA